MRDIEICGFTIDRDENSARNLEYLSTPLDIKHLTGGLLSGSTGSSPGSYACGDTSGGGTRQRTLAGPTRPTGHVSLKQEADTKYSRGNIWVNAVERLLLLGPPGSGKTTLAINFLCNGWRCLSDEVLLINPKKRKVWPFPRCFHVDHKTLKIILDFHVHIYLREIFCKKCQIYIDNIFLSNTIFKIQCY